MIIRVIINPISGRKCMLPVVEALKQTLEKRNCSVEIMPTTGPGDATRFASKLPDSTHAVVVAGGDGTVREVVQGLIGRSVPLVVLPSGTENVLAKHFRFRDEIDSVVSTVTNGKIVNYDVGVCGNKNFILMVSAGFDAEVVRRLSFVRKGHISYWSYVIPILRSLFGYTFPEIRVEIDGKQVFEGPGMVWTGIIPRYAVGMKILSNARTDDGLLDVFIMPCKSRFRLIGQSLRIFLGRHLNTKGAQYHQCREVRFTAIGEQNVPMQIDGDYAGSLPTVCGITTPGVKFLVPPGNKYS